MGRFTDARQRDWNVEITVATIKRIRTALNVNLLDVAEDDGKLAGRLSTDPILLVDVLFVTCQPQATARGITDEDFGEGLFGDQLEAASTALWDALVAFFPPAKRRLLEKAMTKLAAYQEKTMDLCHRRLDSPELDARLDAILAKTEHQLAAPSTN